jgi:hypothetical protein
MTKGGITGKWRRTAATANLLSALWQLFHLFSKRANRKTGQFGNLLQNGKAGGSLPPKKL